MRTQRDEEMRASFEQEFKDQEHLLRRKMEGDLYDLKRKIQLEKEEELKNFIEGKEAEQIRMDISTKEERFKMELETSMRMRVEKAVLDEEDRLRKSKIQILQKELAGEAEKTKEEMKRDFEANIKRLEREYREIEYQSKAEKEREMQKRLREEIAEKEMSMKQDMNLEMQERINQEYLVQENFLRRKKEQDLDAFRRRIDEEKIRDMQLKEEEVNERYTFEIKEMEQSYYEKKEDVIHNMLLEFQNDLSSEVNSQKEVMKREMEESMRLCIEKELLDEDNRIRKSKIAFLEEEFANEEKQTKKRLKQKFEENMKKLESDYQEQERQKRDEIEEKLDREFREKENAMRKQMDKEMCVSIDKEFKDKEHSLRCEMENKLYDLKRKIQIENEDKLRKFVERTEAEKLHMDITGKRSIIKKRNGKQYAHACGK